jgi:hypothetical protein
VSGWHLLVALLAAGCRPPTTDADPEMAPCPDTSARETSDAGAGEPTRHDRCGDETTLLAALERDRSRRADDDVPLSTVFDDYDALATREFCRHPLATIPELRTWMDGLPHITTDSSVFRIRDETVVFVWAHVDESCHGGGGRASVFERGEAIGHVDSDDDCDSFSLVVANAAHGWFLLANGHDGNGWPPSIGIVVALGRDGMQVLRTGDVAEIDRDGGDGAVVTRFGHAVSSYPRDPIYQYRWRIAHDETSLVFRETAITPWLDAVDDYCASHVCIPDVERVRHRGSRATVWLDDGDPSDGQTFTVERRHGTWRVVTCAGRCRAD